MLLWDGSTLKLPVPVLYAASLAAIYPFICGLRRGWQTMAHRPNPAHRLFIKKVLLGHSHAHSFIVNKFVYAFLFPVL